MKIGLVRHGETDWNLNGKIQGHTDIPLNESGLKQANRLAERLYKEDRIWDCIITSDLQRAYITGKIIADKLNIPIIGTDERLRELFLGDVEGTTKEERDLRWGTDFDYIVNSAVVGGESNEQLYKRGNELLNELKAKYPDKNILIVTHGGFIARMLGHLFTDIEDKRIGNVSYNILEDASGSWKLCLHNCMKHLDE